jgi:rare lipoprotein A
VSAVFTPPHAPSATRAPLSDSRSLVVRWLRPACMVMAIALSGCASGVAKTPLSAPTLVASASMARLAPPALRPGPARDAEWDGPSGVAAAELDKLQDAEPTIQPIRPGGPNRPYRLRGRSYVPLTEDRPFRESGLASWYGRKFHGRLTASGEVYDMHAMTAAHPTLPLPSYVRVTNPSNGREVVVRVNDRGPFHRGRIIDLSYAAAHRLGVSRGVGRVEVQRLTFQDIRTGAWRRAPPRDAPRLPESILLAQAQAQAPAAPAAPPAMVDPGVPAETPMVYTAFAEAPATGVPTGLVTAVSTHEPPASWPADTAPKPTVAPAAPGFWVQLGIFPVRDGAEGFQRQVVAEARWLGPVLGVLSEADLHRLLAGPYPSQDEAMGVARRVREALSLVPLVVERR